MSETKFDPFVAKNHTITSQKGQTGNYYFLLLRTDRIDAIVNTRYRGVGITPFKAMNILSKITRKKLAPEQVDVSCVIVAYKSKSGLWRGFAYPYDVTYEDEDRNKVVTVLEEMAASYREGLSNHNFPEHLKNVPLYNEEDRNYFGKLALKSIIQKGKMDGPDLYVSTATFA